MAIRKNNSRQSDRNKIYKMNAQGYSVLQIEAKLSITPEHITYILNQYQTDLAERRANSPELQARARIQAEVESRRVHSGPAHDPDLADIKAQLRREIMAELTADAPVKTIPSVRKQDFDTYDTVTVAGEDESLPADIPDTPAATDPDVVTRPRRKRKA